MGSLPNRAESPDSHENTSRTAPRPWHPDEEAKLRDMIGTHTIPTIARYLRRTPKAIRSKLGRMQTASDEFAGFKAKDLVNWFGVTSKQVRRWREKGYLRSAAGRITEESVEAFCREHPEKIPYYRLGPDIQLWLRELGYPAVDGVPPRELAQRLHVSRRIVTHWVRQCWLREIAGRITFVSFRRFCRLRANQIPWERLADDELEWLRSVGCGAQRVFQGRDGGAAGACGSTNASTSSNHA